MSLKDKMMSYLQSDRRRSHYISELDETIYFSPVTVLEMEKIFTLSSSGTITKDYHIYTIIEKAENEKGEKIFTIEDKPFLEKLDWKIISDASNEIHRRISVEDAKKNSPKTPSS